MKVFKTQHGDLINCQYIRGVHRFNEDDETVTVSVYNSHVDTRADIFNGDVDEANKVMLALYLFTRDKMRALDLTQSIDDQLDQKNLF